MTRIPASITADAVAREKWPEPGDRMRFLGVNGYPFELEAALKVMQPGDCFTVKSCDVGSYSHSVVFAEIPGSWNGVMFDFEDAHPFPQGEADTVAERRGNRAGPKSTPTGSVSSQDLTTVPLGGAGETEPGDLVGRDMVRAACWAYDADNSVYDSVSDSDRMRKALASALSSLRAERDWAKSQHEKAGEQFSELSRLFQEQGVRDGNRITAAESSLAAEKQRVVELERALTPFAERCDDAVHPEDHDTSGLVVKVGFLRAARAALRPAETGDGQ